MQSESYRIAVVDHQSVASIDKQQLKRVIQAALRSEGIQQAAISVALFDDRVITDLNRQFLQHDRATDVLSFPLHKDGARVEGDIAISVETAAREARARGIPVETEVALYAVHGVLHLVGYDDQTPQERRRMWDRQLQILRTLHYDTNRLL